MNQKNIQELLVSLDKLSGKLDKFEIMYTDYLKSIVNKGKILPSEKPVKSLYME